MAESDLVAQVVAARIVPVVTLTHADQAWPLADALIAGGIRAIEVTLRTAAGLGALEELGDRGDLMVGAGTVLTVEQASQACAAGARFAVSPGLDAAIVSRLREHGALPLPGVATATEVQQAHRLGLRAVKLFPAELLGGLDLVRALHGPFPDMRFLPSGGVTAANAGSYAGHPAILAVSGSWMVPNDAILAGDWGRIADLAAEAVASLEGAA